MISNEKFEILKSNRKFLKILILARFINALRFCQMCSFLQISDSEGTYAHKRQKINGPLFSSAVLYEGFRFAEKALETDKDFKTMDIYNEGIGAIINDSKNINLINNGLSIIRNKFVFHFEHKNITNIDKYLSNFHSSSYSFASAHGEAAGNMYYGLADQFFINYLIDPKGTKSDNELRESLKTLYQDTGNLMDSFIDATEKLIAEVLLQLGLTLNVAICR